MMPCEKDIFWMKNILLMTILWILSVDLILWNSFSNHFRILVRPRLISIHSKNTENVTTFCRIIFAENMSMHPYWSVRTWTECIFLISNFFCRWEGISSSRLIPGWTNTSTIFDREIKTMVLEFFSLLRESLAEEFPWLHSVRSGLSCLVLNGKAWRFVVYPYSVMAHKL